MYEPLRKQLNAAQTETRYTLESFQRNCTNKIGPIERSLKNQHLILVALEVLLTKINKGN